MTCENLKMCDVSDQIFLKVAWYLYHEITLADAEKHYHSFRVVFLVFVCFGILASC